MLESISTVGVAITALGGPTAVARLTRRKPQHVINWRKSGRFPPTTYLSLSKALAAIGKIAPAELWSMEDEVVS